MSGWRKFTDHKEESKAVKAMLSKQYAKVTARHGRGTAWGWLRVEFTIPRPADCYCSGYDADGVDWREVRKNEYSISCRHCGREYSRVMSEVSRQVQDFTGRTGDYGGCINYQINWAD